MMVECAGTNQVKVMFGSMIPGRRTMDQMVTGAFRGGLRIMPDRTVLLTGHQAYSSWAHKKVAEVVGSLPDGANLLRRMEEYSVDPMFSLKMKYASDYVAWKLSENALRTLQNCVDRLNLECLTSPEKAFLHQVSSDKDEMFETLLRAGKEALAAADMIARFRDPGMDQPGIIEKDEAASLLTEQEYDEAASFHAGRENDEINRRQNHRQNRSAKLRAIRGGLRKPVFPVSRKPAFWVISLALSVAIACLLYFTIGQAFFKGLELFEYMSPGAYHFFSNIAPYVVIVGGIVGAVVYDLYYAGYSKYDLATYAKSAGLAVVGCVTGGSLIYASLMMILFFVYAWFMVIFAGLIFLSSNN